MLVCFLSSPAVFSIFQICICILISCSISEKLQFSRQSRSEYVEMRKSASCLTKCSKNLMKGI